MIRYANNDPVYFSDPTGLAGQGGCSWCEPGGPITFDREIMDPISRQPQIGSLFDMYTGGYFTKEFGDGYGYSGPGSGNYWSDGSRYSDWSLWGGSQIYRNGRAMGLTDLGGTLHRFKDGEFQPYVEKNGMTGFLSIASIEVGGYISDKTEFIEEQQQTQNGPDPFREVFGLIAINGTNRFAFSYNVNDGTGKYVVGLDGVAIGYDYDPKTLAKTNPVILTQSLDLSRFNNTSGKRYPNYLVEAAKWGDLSAASYFSAESLAQDEALAHGTLRHRYFCLWSVLSPATRHAQLFHIQP